MAAQSGVVKSFNATKGWGFINCPAAGVDAFFMKSDLNGFGASQGDQVSFMLTQGDRGYKAVNISVLPGADGAQTFMGEVKSYNPTKGFGFVSSTASTQLFGKDVFFMKSNIAGAAVPTTGAQVQFKAALGDRGPVASEVQVLGGGAPAMPQMAMQMPMQMQTMQKQPQMQMQQSQPMRQQPMQQMQMQQMRPKPVQQMQMQPMQMQQMQPMQMQMPGMGMQMAPNQGMLPTGAKVPKETEVFFGAVKSINMEKGWGHITCDATHKIFGKDMFILKTSVEAAGPLEAGQPVSFTVSQGPKGPHAMNINLFNEPPMGTSFSGTVQSFNDMKGWGFIQSPDAQQFFGGNIFFHKNEAAGMAPKQGDMVSFTIDFSSGRAQAKGVNSGFGAAPRQTMAGMRASPY